ncbi:YdcF family protein [Candidatus Woesearchaeota archaeon]|nr:YdcF family protein [Candidatus Woesearchaeota archaeon]
MKILVVLGGSLKSDGSLAFKVKARADLAFKKFSKENYDFIIASGNHSISLNFTPKLTEANAIKKYLVLNGLTEDKIILEEQSKDTIGNAYYTKLLIMNLKPIQEICVITSKSHIKRSEYIFKKVFGPSHNLRFVGSEENISDVENNYKKETSILKVTKNWLDPIRDGDHKAIYLLIKKLYSDKS